MPVEASSGTSHQSQETGSFSRFFPVFRGKEGLKHPRMDGAPAMQRRMRASIGNFLGEKPPPLFSGLGGINQPHIDLGFHRDVPKQRCSALDSTKHIKAHTPPETHPELHRSPQLAKDVQKEVQSRSCKDLFFFLCLPRCVSGALSEPDGFILLAARGDPKAGKSREVAQKANQLDGVLNYGWKFAKKQ